MKKYKNKKRKIVLVVLIIMQCMFLTGGDFFKKVQSANLLSPSESMEPVPDLAQPNLKGPRADVVFNKSIDGINLEANAVVTGFEKEDKFLYFTWYLKRDDGKDLDGDGKYDENDWKIEAAKIIAKGNYSGQSSGNVSGDDDGYKAVPNWTGKNSDPECYVQDFEDGRIYELKQTEQTFSCNSAACVSERNLSCEDPENPGNFSATSACQEEVASPNCKVKNAENFTTTASCSAGSLRCSDGSANIFSSSLTQTQMCSQITYGSGGASCASLDLTTPTCTFKEKSSGNICKHLFPDPGVSGEDSGDGKFGSAEENFWGTDPNNSSTAGNGNVDEANVVGLGVNIFKWQYKKGDHIGLVVEGESLMNTKHNDGSKMIMWAFSKNKCSAISDAADEKAFYVEDSFGFKQGILTIGEIDLDDCLEENLIDPAVTTESGYLDISVSIIPEEPLNDALIVGTNNKGSVVTASAIINNADEYKLSYVWDLEISSDGTASPALWKNITSSLTDHDYFSGTGNSRFKFKLNLPLDVFPNEKPEQYLRIKVSAVETGDFDREGIGYKIFKIKQKEPEIISYNAKYSTSTGKLYKGEEFCKDSAGSACLVANNQVVGVSMPDPKNTLTGFSWKINGKPLICDNSVSDMCEAGKAANLAFFPAIGLEGDEFIITGEAVDKSTGIVKKFEKTFRITSPYVKIVSGDTNSVWPKRLGYFKNLDGSFRPDFSEILFQTIENTEVEMKAAIFPDSIVGSEGTTIAWKINGEETPSASFVASGGVGAVYNVGVEVSYKQPQETRMALEKFWGVSQTQTAEELFEHSVQVETLKSEYDEVVAMKKTGILANLLSNTSNQIIFVLRLVVMVALIIGISGIAFSINPSIGKKE